MFRHTLCTNSFPASGLKQYPDGWLVRQAAARLDAEKEAEPKVHAT